MDLAPNWAKNRIVPQEKPLPWSDASFWRQGIGIRISQVNAWVPQVLHGRSGDAAKSRACW
jgi:hypothetical protein